VRYEVLVSRDIRTGVVTVGVRIEGFEHLASRSGDPVSVCKWMMTAGMTLIRLVDAVIDRAGLPGKTLLIAEFGEDGTSLSAQGDLSHR
jgi:hypothetical protein